MKNNLILTTFMLWCSFGLFAQNPVWVCPPNFVKNSAAQALPTGPSNNDINDPLDYYDGFSAMGSASGIQDIAGNLRFFIVDGIIYDEAGKFVDMAFQDSPNWLSTTTTTSTSSNYALKYIGFMIGQETTIIPTGRCNRYVIVSSLTKQVIPFANPPENPGDPVTGSVQLRALPVYCIYDAATKTVIQRGSFFDDVDDYNNVQNNPLGSTAIFSEATTSNPLNTNGDSPFTLTDWGNAYLPSGLNGIAVSDLNSDGSRFIVATVGNVLFAIKLESTGNLRYWKRFELPFSFNKKRSSEAELVFNPNTNKFQFAFSMGDFSERIIYCEFDSDFLTMTLSNAISLPYNSVTGYYGVNGMEFSPNNRYLYFTNDVYQPQLAFNKLGYVDVGAGNFSPQFINNTSSSVFNGSFLEATGNGNFLMSTASGLYSVTNPNSPPAISISTSPSIPFSIESTIGVLQTEYFNTRYYPLPDQIDGMNYALHHTTDPQCCVQNQYYDKTIYTASSSATWSPGFGNNPLDLFNDGVNEVTIRDELRIPKGKVVTIDGMELRFAPNAKLIIEAGDGIQNGGRLILNNTKLTVDTRCTSDQLWEGVEVWGNAGLNQGFFTGASQQGRLQITGTSTIEHAKRGVVLSAFNASTGTYVSPRSGGVLRATGTTFRNNQRDVVFWNYLSPQGTNNLSFLSNCNFITDAALKSGVQPINHVELRGVRGVQLTGNDFKHINNVYQQMGTGVFATNSTFTVNARCTSGTYPCTGFDPNVFENLKIGIYTLNSNSAMTFSSDRNLFKNNMIGIWANSTNLATITRNVFDVFESSAQQTGGVYLFKSDKYVVEENDFGIQSTTPLAGAKSYGLVINNSGPAANLVYLNTFENLFIGGQSELDNGETQIGSATGLVWKCNQFRNISKYDLSVLKGEIAYNQGYMDPTNATSANLKAANNLFSLQGEGMPLTHDYYLEGAMPINYVYTQGAMTVPDSYSTAFMTIQQSTFGGVPVISDFNAGCPSRLGKTKVMLTDELTQWQQKLDANQAITASGSVSAMQQILNLSNAGQKKNGLLAVSPYLSDAVLIAYIQQAPPAGHLQQVLLANSPLSDAVLDALQNISIPNGIRNTIMAAQSNTLSALEILQQDSWYASDNFYRTFDDLLRDVILDTTPTRTLDDAVNLLSNRQEKVYQEMLLNIKINRNELTDATALLSLLNGYGRTQDLNEIQINLRAASNSESYFSDAPNDLTMLQSICSDTNYCICSERAKALLCHVQMPVQDYYFFEESSTVAARTSAIGTQEQSIWNKEESLILYPNPTENGVTVETEDLNGATLMVYNTLGSVMLSVDISDDKAVLDFSEFENGIYILVVTDVFGKQKTARILKR